MTGKIEQPEAYWRDTEVKYQNDGEPKSLGYIFASKTHDGFLLTNHYTVQMYEHEAEFWKDYFTRVVDEFKKLK